MAPRIRAGRPGLAWALLIVPAVCGQQPLRVTTRLVELSVIAEDRDGTPVADLTRDDFALFDGGRQERIAVFRVEASGERRTRPQPLPPNVFSNRVDELGTAPSSATVILFDGLNTRLADQPYARQQILKFVQQLKPGDRVALYVMGRGPRVLQDFTEDPSVLGKALSHLTGQMSPSLEAPLYDPAVTAGAHFESWLGELTFDLYDHFAADRAYRTVRALVAIADHLERLPGRKNLIWVSGSFPLSLAQDSVALPRKTAQEKKPIPEVERAVRALSRSNLAIYPVDARGLIAAQEYSGDLRKPQLRNPDTADFAVMGSLAERTGGRAFFNNNDLAAALRRAADDARTSYVVGYYPSHDAWNGKFRKLEVRVRRPEVALHYRRGYFAQPEEPAEPWYRESVLNAAIWSPVDATGLGLMVRAAPAGSGGLELGLQVDARDLAFRQKDDKWECGLDVWLVQLDRKEHELRRDAHRNNLRLDPATYERIMAAKGLMLVEHLAPAPDALLLRVLVRDIASGALGSLTIPLRRPAAGAR